MGKEKQSSVSGIDERSREIFRLIVDTYVETGEPIGSRTLSKLLSASLSPATIRNVMADLEEMGLLYSPHLSAGRLPTELGLKLFVDGLLEIGRLRPEEEKSIEERCVTQGKSLEGILGEATAMLSGLSRCAGLVVAPKNDNALKHIEFVPLNPGKALVVMVTVNGQVENRVVEMPPGIPSGALIAAGNYLNSRLQGRTLDEARSEILAEITQQKTALDEIAARVVKAGIATWSGEAPARALIVRGQSHLLDDINATSDLERIRALFDALETKEQMLKLLELANLAQGVQIFIGAQSDLFFLSGCSMVVAPYKDSKSRIVGAIGVIGPTRINYARIIPLVDFTAKMVGRLIG